jgi:heptosyltransferase-2
MTRILIIRFSSIGDIVLTSPVVRSLKEQLEGEVEIHYLTKAAYASIFDANPYVDKLWTMRDSLDEVLKDLEKIEFDHIIDLHRNLRTAKVKKRVKGLYFSFDKLNFKKWLLVNFGVDKMPDVHIVDRYMETVKAFSMEDDGEGLDYFLPDVVSMNLKPLSLKQGEYLAWVIGAAHEGKRFSASKVSSVIAQVKMPVVLLGGKVDKDLAEEIMESCSGHVVNMVGRTSLHESAWLLDRSKLVVTPDTGMMHIASALKKKVISLWGCTVPELGMYPYRPGDGSMIIEPKDKDKRPCSKLGNRCKYPVNCIESISNEEVLKAIEKPVNQ